MANSIFFLSAILFIWSEIFYIKNKALLNLKFKEREIDSFSAVDVFYYFSRVLYWGWLITGCFSSFYIYFIVLMGMSLSRFIIYHVNRNLYGLYDTLMSLTSLIVMILLIYGKFTG